MSQLKLHVESRPETKHPQVNNFVAVQELCRTFETATGWALSFEGRTGADRGFSLGLAQPQAQPALDRGAATALAGAMFRVVDELAQAKHAVWQREAELAAGVPITSRPEEEDHLAQRLETVLASGAKAVGCQAAALYLLNDATSHLKLRSCWGLSHDKLLEPARPLKGALADLEALLGHAIVLEDTSLLPHWNVPENYPAAVCVPVSSATNPLGTLWLFCDTNRDFSEEQTNLAEIVAGRIAADLEREILLSEGVQNKRVKGQWTAAVTRQEQRLPKMPPLLEGWQVAGWTAQAEGIGGNFHDWMLHHDGRLALSVGDAHGIGLPASFTATLTQAALRSHATYARDPKSLLVRLNDTLWTGSTGDEFASLFFGLIDPESGMLEYSLAGSAALLLVRRGEAQIITTDAPPLGTGPEIEYHTEKQVLLPGDFLVALSEGVHQARDRNGTQCCVSALVNLIRRATQFSAAQLTQRICEMLGDHCPPRPGIDRTLLVVKRSR
jgi:sigma-B regulation protein RsbU (phosphoserine phosphatase)